jgi:hypothetical protein
MLGDHIRALKDGRWLHGIDLGDQRVLFLVEAPGLAPGDRLRRVYRPEFTANATKVELVVHREPAYPAKAVVARAWSRFMDPSVVAMFRDSEAFAAWCKIGRLPEAAPAAPPPGSPVAVVKRAAKVASGPEPKAPPKKAKPARAAPKKAAKAAKRPAPASAKRAPARKPAAKKAAPRKAPAKKAAVKAPARKPTPRKKSRR